MVSIIFATLFYIFWYIIWWVTYSQSATNLLIFNKLQNNIIEAGRGERSENVVPLSPVPPFCGDIPSERDERAKIYGRKNIFYVRKNACGTLKPHVSRSDATYEEVKAMEWRGQSITMRMSKHSNDKVKG